jgi:lactose/L-arabinose transport system permease protein
MATFETTLKTRPQPTLVPRRTGRVHDMVRSRWAYLFIAPFYVLFIIFFLYPIVLSFYLSFCDWTGVGDIKFVWLANFERLLGDERFWESMRNGVYLFFMYVPIMTFLALVLAVILNSRRVRGFQFFRTLIFMPYITNMVAAGFAFRLLLTQQNGLVNIGVGLFGIPPIPWLEDEWWARISLCLLIIWAWLGYNMVLMLAGLQTIPLELNEAALIDGANPVQSFFYITVPLMRPVILFSVILSTIGSFGLFPEIRSLFYSTQGSGPLNATITPILAIFRQAFDNHRLGYAAAMSYTYFAFIFVVTILQLRYFGSQDD